MPLGAYILCPTTVSRSASSAATSTGILPTAWAASVCSGTPCSWAMRASSAIGWMVPVSLFANMIDTRTVCGVIAAARSCGSTRPWRSTGRTVTSHAVQALQGAAGGQHGRMLCLPG